MKNYISKVKILYVRVGFNYEKISVILAVHNGQEYIQETLTSLLSQTYKEFEIIIVLNCSSDATKEIIQKLDDARIFLYETSVCQLAFNLNYGLNKASGEYIVRIDADDIADPKRLEKQLETIEKYGYDVVGTNITYIDENTQPIGKKYTQNITKRYEKLFFIHVHSHTLLLCIKKRLLWV